jgi:hypothetical protein
VAPDLTLLSLTHNVTYVTYVNVRVIRIDEDVYRDLQARATPFVDTPNAVLRRLLGLNEPGKVGGQEVNDGVFLFGHSSGEFPGGVKDLQEFLREALKTERQGRYNVVSARRYKRVGLGSRVLFHKAREIVGEATVSQPLSLNTGPETDYEAYLVFDVPSIVVFRRPIGFDEAEELLGTKINPRAVQLIDREGYEAFEKLAKG